MSDVLRISRACLKCKSERIYRKIQLYRSYLRSYFVLTVFCGGAILISDTGLPVRSSSAVFTADGTRTSPVGMYVRPSKSALGLVGSKGGAKFELPPTTVGVIGGGMDGGVCCGTDVLLEVILWF